MNFKGWEPKLKALWRSSETGPGTISDFVLSSIAILVIVIVVPLIILPIMLYMIAEKIFGWQKF